ncbi:MAG: hypothetical protein LBQ83_03790, partial [Candidatus Margulisbacteria bacterium]|nr:hypothetical protein [Candidatus Margulisiibacteriota bacterium]
QYHGAQKENIWEYFFEQPCGYTLTDIRRSRHIILSPEYRLFMPKKYAIAHNAVSLRHKKLFQKYIRFNKETRAYLEFDYKKIVKQKNRKVLGVLCRGTDYIKRFNLPIQPDPQVVLQKARRVMLAHKCTHLYLATEDEAIYKLFLAYFGKKLLTNRQRHFDWSKDYGKKKLLSQVSMSNAERRQIALDYLSSLNILARCPCFIGGNTAGTSAVYLMSQGFEYDYLWDLGLYPLDILGRLSSVLRH